MDTNTTGEGYIYSYAGKNKEQNRKKYDPDYFLKINISYS